MTTENSYDDPRRAGAYALLEFPGTYYLAYRDLPSIIKAHARGGRALDFGCGAGRSTRFLRRLGFDAIGVDISDAMIRKAREIDPQGDYRRIEDGAVGGLGAGSLALVLCAFTFDNIPTMDRKVGFFRELRGLLAPGGAIVNLVSTPDIYVNEWASFSTRDYPENRHARRGDTVRIVITDIADPRPVEDVLWPADAYHETFERADVTLVETYTPLGRAEDPVAWVSETRVAPWAIHVLKAGRLPRARRQRQTNSP